jgi:hypothetical protein
MSRKTKRTAQQKVDEKIIELGNLALASIVFVQLIPDKKINFPLFLLGVILYIIFYVLGYITIKES